MTDNGAELFLKALADNFACIARIEQDLLHHRRASAMSAAQQAAKPDTLDDVDRLLALLKVDHINIDQAVERLQPSDSMLLKIASMPVDDLLVALNGMAMPNEPFPQKPEPHKVSRWLPALLVKAQLFDAWLEPAFNLAMPLNVTQENLRNAFVVDGHVLLPDGAMLLPRKRISWRDEDREATGVFARHLRMLAYIPAHLDCDDPNVLEKQGIPISASFQMWDSSALLGRPVPREPLIAVAPLAERGSDVAFVPSPSRREYALTLAYDDSRLRAAVDRALEQGVHILLIPEMAQPEGNAADFETRMRDLMLSAGSDYYHRTGQVGELRLVLAGVLGNVQKDGFHSNYVIALDANGDQPHQYRQNKLSHWNLTRPEQDRFGITHYHAPQGELSDPINENSIPAQQFIVLEIPGLGRTATLICADMSQNNPGDWLSINALLDCLYAPIMDKSTCWQISDEKKTSRPWIVKRSYRSARLTNTLVITTNSMALSRWVNEANDKQGSAWPRYTKVGIGLALDGRKRGLSDDDAQLRPLSYSHLLVDIDQQNVMATFAFPISGWPDFPLLPVPGI